MAVDLAPAPPGPLPPEQLLRWGGSDDPSRSDGANAEAAESQMAMVIRDATRILGSSLDGVMFTRWRARPFIREVETVRAHLAPITEPALLLSSLGREAFHGRRAIAPPIGTAGPVRIAYTIRWIELVTDLQMPEWSLWTTACTPDA